VDEGAFDLMPIAEKNVAWPLASHAMLMVGIIDKVEWNPSVCLAQQRTINLASRVRVL
jgi:hypothetical protein